MRALVFLAALAVLAGCGGSKSGTPPEGREGTTATADRARPSPAEVRWVGQGLDWVHALQGESEDLMRALLALEEGRTKRIEPSLAAIRAIDDRCTEPRIERPVTRRLTSLHEKLLHLCYHVGGAVESLRIALDPPDYAIPNSATTSADVRTFKKNWQRGGELARQAGREAAAYAPTNAQALPERDGGAESHVAPKLGAAATKLAGEEAVVQCWSRRDWSRALTQTSRFLNERAEPGIAGFVLFGDHRINLPPDVCATLESGRGAFEERAFALGTLAHEARHVSGTVNETTATCQAIDDLPRAAGLLGDPDGARLANVFREAVRPRLPRAYRAFDC